MVKLRFMSQYDALRSWL